MTAPAVTASAELSADGLHRFSLSRTWSPELAPMVFVGLNPSTADGTQDDPTIRRCMAFARREGCGGIVVVNLFSQRATDPDDLDARKLQSAAAAVGRRHRAWILREARGPLVAAWGATAGPPAVARLRALEIGEVLQVATRPWVCLGRTQDGSPRHPLYLPRDASFESFALEKAA